MEIGFNSATGATNVLVANGGADNDTLSFGAGNDSVTFNATGGVSVHRVGTTNSNLTVSGFEFYTGGAGNDTLDASAASASMNLSGGAGNDVIYASSVGGNVVLDGGNDIIHLSALSSGAGADILTMTSLNGNSTVNNFTTADRIDDSALTGWTRNISRSDGNALITWTNGGNTVQVNLINVGDNTIHFGYETSTVPLSF